MMLPTRWRLPLLIYIRRGIKPQNLYAFVVDFYDLQIEEKQKMKTLKFVSYASLIVLLIVIGLTISIPFRFPNSSVTWSIIITTNILLMTLCALLFLLPRVKISTLQEILLCVLLVSLIFMIAGWTPWIFTVIFLVALFGIYIAFSQYSEA